MPQDQNPLLSKYSDRLPQVKKKKPNAKELYEKIYSRGQGKGSEGTNQQQPTLTKPKKQDYGITSADEGFEAGKNQLIGGASYVLGEGAGYLGFDEVKKDLQDYSRKIIENSPKNDDSWGYFLGSLTPSILPTAGAIATAPISAPLAGAAGVASIAGLSLSSGGMGMMEYEQYQQEKGREVDPLKKLAVGTAYATAEGVMETFQLGKLMPSGLGNKIAGKIFKGSSEAAEKAGQDLLQKYAKAKPKRYRELVNRVQTGSGTEGLEEVATEIAQTATQLLYQDNEDRKKTVEQLPTNLFHAALGGSIMGGALGPISYGSQKLTNRKRRYKQGHVYIAETSDGDSVELLQKTEQDGKKGYMVMNPDESTRFVANEDLNRTVGLKPEQFENLLKDRAQSQQLIEEWESQERYFGTYNDQQVEVINQDEKGNLYIKLPDGSQKHVMKEQVSEITPITNKEIEDQKEISEAAQVDAQSKAEGGFGIQQDPDTGEYVRPDEPGYNRVIEKLYGEGASQLGEASQITVGAGKKKRNITIREKGKDFQVMSVQTEEGEVPVNELTPEELNNLANDVTKYMEGSKGNFTVNTERVDPDDLDSPMMLEVLNNEGDKAKRLQMQEQLGEYEVQMQDSKINVVNPQGEQVGKRSKYYYPKIVEFFEQTYDEWDAMPRATDSGDVQETEFVSRVERDSENPLEIAEAYIYASETAENEEAGRLKELAIAEDLRDSKIPSFDLEGRDLESNIAFAQYASKRADVDIAMRSEYLSDQTGIEITEDDIMDFIRENPGGPGPVLNRKPETLQNLEDHFQEITGVPLTQNLANRITSIQSQTSTVVQESTESDQLDFDTIEGEQVAQTGKEQAPIEVQVQEVEQQLKDEGVSDEEIESIKQADIDEQDLASAETAIEDAENEEEAFNEVSSFFEGMGQEYAQPAEGRAVQDEEPATEPETTAQDQESTEETEASQEETTEDQIAEIEQQRQDALDYANYGDRQQRIEQGRENTKTIFSSLKEKFKSDTLEGKMLSLLEKLLDISRFSTIPVDNLQSARGGKANGEAFEGGINLDTDVYNRLLEGDPKAVKTFIHELVHQVFSTSQYDAYKDGRESNLTEKEVQAWEQLERIYNKAKQNTSRKDEYGYTSLSEFLAEAFSNSSFQRDLSEMEGEGKQSSLFKDIINHITTIIQENLNKWAKKFNKEAPNVTSGLLEDVAYWSEQLIDIDSKIAPDVTVDEINKKFDEKISDISVEQETEQATESTSELSEEESSQDANITEEPTRSEELSNKEQELKDDLNELFDEFDRKSRGSARTGIDPELISLSGKIISKGTQLGYVKFQQFADFVINQKGADFFRRIFTNFKAAYSANVAMQGNPNDEDMNVLSKATAEDFISEEVTEEAVQGQPNEAEEVVEGRPRDKRLWETDDWVDYIKEIGFENISFADFRKALTFEEGANQLITYYFDGEEIASYHMYAEPNSAPLRRWYNERVEEATETEDDSDLQSFDESDKSPEWEYETEGRKYFRTVDGGYIPLFEKGEIFKHKGREFEVTSPNARWAEDAKDPDKRYNVTININHFRAKSTNKDDDSDGMFTFSNYHQPPVEVDNSQVVNYDPEFTPEFNEGDRVRWKNPNFTEADKQQILFDDSGQQPEYLEGVIESVPYEESGRYTVRMPDKDIQGGPVIRGKQIMSGQNFELVEAAETEQETTEDTGQETESTNKPTPVGPMDGWRDNLIKARKYAIDLNIMDEMELRDKWSNREALVQAIDEYLANQDGIGTQEEFFQTAIDQAVESRRKFLDNPDNSDNDLRTVLQEEIESQIVDLFNELDGNNIAVGAMNLMDLRMDELIDRALEQRNIEQDTAEWQDTDEDAYDITAGEEVEEFQGNRFGTKQLFKELSKIVDVANIKPGFHERRGKRGETIMPLGIEAQELPYYYRVDRESNEEGYLLITEQFYIQNGDLMSDPRVDFAVFPESGTAYPVRMVQHGLPSPDQTLVEDGKYYNKAINDVKRFVQNTWIPNLIDQGRGPQDRIDSIPGLTEKENVFVQTVLGNLSEGAAISNTEQMIQIAKDAGMVMGEDYQNPKDLYDMAELALVIHVKQELSNKSIINEPDAMIDYLNQVSDYLPQEGYRSEEQQIYQQFSTPLAYSYAAAYAGMIRNSDTVLEPSAGLGNIALFGMLYGANTHVNELNNRRRKLLQAIGAESVHGEDAGFIHAMPTLNDIQPEVVLMNPPFSREAERTGDKLDVKVGSRHVESALMKLKDNGRLVAIVSSAMDLNDARFRKWWDKIKKKYTVRANFLVSGKAYAKKGTNFDNRLLIIDKITPERADYEVQTGKAESYDQLISYIDNTESRTYDRQNANTDQREESGTQPSGERRSETDTGRDGADTESGSDAGSRTSILTDDESGNRVQSGGSVNTGRVSDGRSNEGSDSTEPELFDGSSERSRDGGRDRGNDAGSTRSGSSDAIITGRDSDSDDSGQDGLSSSQTDQSSREDQYQVNRQEKEKSSNKDIGYDRYEPEFIIEGSKDHPAPLVESTAMASVDLPPVDYSPRIPENYIRSGALSKAQLEDIMLAGKANNQLNPNGTRKGFFLGAGTGYGKGRTIGGIIVDNWKRGRQKAVWVSKNAKAHQDSKEYLEAVGGQDIPITWQNKAAKLGENIELKKGVLLTTYRTVAYSSQKGSRVDQLVDWLGEDFDGVVVFDESHLMANAKDTKDTRGTKKASQRALAGLDLQERLPKARIIYSSATGATEVMNYTYANRLGLWGEGTSFADNTDFIKSIESSGVSAMEIIAKDLKALGLYTAKSISYEGVEYDSLEHDLTPEQIELYNKTGQAWQIVFDNINEALELNNTDGLGRGQAVGQFWGSVQRFYNTLITTMSMPTVLQELEEQVSDGNSVVIQLINTHEAQLDRALTSEKYKAKQENRPVDLEALDLSNKSTMLDYLEHSFPTDLYTTKIDDNGNERQVKVRDSEGNPVENPEAVAMRDRLIQQIDEMLVLPEAPIDMIINRFGPDNVAEVTGRTKRIVKRRDDNGQMVRVEESWSETKALNDVKEFQNDEKQVLIFSQAGGTGASFHADRNAKNQRQRMHYVLQAGWRADVAVQGFGRTHRSNQKQPPVFKLVKTNVKAQRRFLSSIARRLEQLGALTKGQRDTGGGGVLDGSFNLEGEYAKQGLFATYKQVADGDVEGVAPSILENQMALKLEDEDSASGWDTKEATDTKRFMNRIMALPIDTQNILFDTWMENMEAEIESAIQEGTYEEGIQAVEAESITMVDRNKIHHDDTTGASTYITDFDVEKANEKKTYNEVRTKARVNDGKFKGFFKHKTSGNIYAVRELGQTADASGFITTKYRRYGIGHDTIIQEDEFNNGKYLPVDGVTAEDIWTEQYEDYPETRTIRESIVEGLILPIWSRLPSKIDVRRYIDQDGVAHLGRYFKSQDIEQIRQEFEVMNSEVYTPEIINDALGSGGEAKLANGITFRSGQLNGEPVVEVDMDSIPIGKGKVFGDYGFQKQVINAMMGRYQYYIPSNQAGDAIDRMANSLNSPVVNVTDADGNTVPGQKREDGGDIRYSVREENQLQDDRQRTSLDYHFENIKTHIDGITSQWRNSDFVEVVKEVDDLPEQIVGEIDRHMARGSVRGVFRGKNLYLITDNIRNRSDAEQTLAHEAFGHLGLRVLTDYQSKSQGEYKQRMDELLNDIYTYAKDSDSDRLETIKKNYGLDFRWAADRKIGAEEYLAQLAEGDLNPTLWDKIVKFVNDALRNLGFNVNMSKADILKVIRDGKKLVTGEVYQVNVFQGSTRRSIYLDRKWGMPFYSDLEQTLDIKLPNAGTKATYKEAIEGMQRKGDFRKSEIEWLGLYEWLDKQSGKIYKDDVINFVKDHNVKMEEVMKGTDMALSKDEAMNEINTLLSGYDMTMEVDMDGEPYFIDQQAEEELVSFDTVKGIIEELGPPEDAELFADLSVAYIDAESGNTVGTTKYSQWTLPGGENYREMLITLPPKKPENTDFKKEDGVWVAYRDGEEIGYNENITELREQIGSDYNTLLGSNQYRSSHWDESNVLAHVRFNERTVNGKRMLFLEEIQSDWHQEGRKKGYQDEWQGVESELTEINQELSNIRQEVADTIGSETNSDYNHSIDMFKIYRNDLQEGVGESEIFSDMQNMHPNGSFSEDLHNRVLDGMRRYVDLTNKAVELNKKLNNTRNAVPNAPFKSTWHELVMKRMIRYASENGFDSVGWAPGEVHNERYDLSKRIDNIERSPSVTYGEGRSSVEIQLSDNQGLIQIAVRDEDRKVIDVESSSIGLAEDPDVLDDIIGKELAERVMGQEYYEPLSGEGLEIGGEGMKGFYDKILPRFMNSYLKKWESNLGVESLSTLQSSTNIVQQLDAGDWGVWDTEGNQDQTGFSTKEEAEGYAVAQGYLSEESISQDIWSFPVTEDMKESVLETGQPLFQLAAFEGDTRFNLQRSGPKLDNEPYQYKRWWDTFIRRFQDAGIAAKRTIEGVLREGGIVNDQNNFYLDENLSKGRIGERLRKFDEGDRQELIDLMKEGNKQAGITHEDFNDYLYARHAKEVNEHFRQKFPGREEEFGSGMTDAEADAVMEKFIDNGWMEYAQPVAEKVDEILENNLNNLRAYGLISAGQYAAMKEQWEYYVPLRGFDDWNEYDPTLYVLPKKRKGRRSKAGDILAYTTSMYKSTVIRGEQNLVKQKALRFFQENYDRPDIAEIQNVYWKPLGEVDPDTGKERYAPVYTKPTAEQLLKGEVIRDLNPQKHAIPENPFEDNQVPVMVDGRAVTIKFTEPHVAEWLKGTDLDTLNESMGFLRKYMAYLRNAYITYSPEFSLRNVFRDGLLGGFHLATDFDMNLARKVLQGVGPSIGAMKRAVRNNDFSGERGRYAKLFLERGAISGYFQLNEIRDISKKLKHHVDNQGKNWYKSKEGIKWVGQVMEHYTTAIENGVRLSTFQHLLQDNVINERTGKPYTEKQAAEYAKNLTVNFNRKGAWASTIGNIFIFFNATMQGIVRQFEPFRSGNTARRRLRAAGASIAMAGLGYAMTELLRLYMGYDEEDDEYKIDKMNEYTLAHRFLLPNFFTDDEDDFISIPLPYGVNVYWAAGVYGSKVANGVMETSDMALSLLSQSWQAFNPIGGEVVTSEDTGYSALKSVMPTIFAPPFELITNVDYKGDEIYPEQFPFGPEKPDFQNYKFYTSDWAINLAKLMNKATGGTDYASGIVDVSPNSLEFIANSYLGGIGNFAQSSLASAGQAIDHVTGKEEMTYEDVIRIPAVRVFFSKVSNAAPRKSFSSNRDEIEELERQYEQIAENEGREKAFEFYKEHEDMMDLLGLKDATRSRISDLYDYLDGLDARGASQQKKDEVLEEIRRTYQEFNKRVNRAKGRGASQNPTPLTGILKQ